MKRTDQGRNALLAAFAVASLSIAPSAATAAADACPAPVPNHVPDPPLPLNLGTIKQLLYQWPETVTH